MGGLTRREERLLADVDRSIADGVSIMRWWRQADATNDFDQRFELTHVFNRPDTGYAFFDVAPLADGTPLPVNGDVPQLFYDQPKGLEFSRWCEEVREFSLRYFMRIADFRLPQATVDESAPRPPELLAPFAWCPRSTVVRQGFGFEQVYYKTLDGLVGRFGEDEAFAIVDARDLGRRFQWVVAAVSIFSFDLSFPPDPDLPRLTVPLPEKAWVVLAPQFVTDESAPEPGVCARYGFGYSMLPPTGDDGSFIAYGPGQFQAGFQLFEFSVLESGYVSVRMPFVVDRPSAVVRLNADPFDWAALGAEIATLGRGGRWIEPLRLAADLPPFRWGRAIGFDPVFTGIELFNLATLGWARRTLCISREQLEKLFLVFHFSQYYTMMTGSLLTWRQIADWRDEATLPEWVITGRSS